MRQKNRNISCKIIFDPSTNTIGILKGAFFNKKNSLLINKNKVLINKRLLAHNFVEGNFSGIVVGDEGFDRNTAFHFSSLG